MFCRTFRSGLMQDHIDDLVVTILQLQFRILKVLLQFGGKLFCIVDCIGGDQSEKDLHLVVKVVTQLRCFPRNFCCLFLKLQGKGFVFFKKLQLSGEPFLVL